MNLDRLNPKIDFVFRRLFGSEENKDLLISLINSVVEPDPAIVDVTIKNPYNLAAYQGAKESILDIKAVDENGVWYDIEMQVEAHSLYGRRAVYYLAKTYSDQLGVGEDYSNLNTAIGIHFLDFVYFADEHLMRQFVLTDTRTGPEPITLNDLHLYFIEMPKFDKEWNQIRTGLDRWLAFLNRGAGLDQATLPKQMVDDPAVARAISALERSGLSPREREIYDGEVKKKMVDAVQIRDAEQKGRQEGVQIGKEEGVQIGIQEGRLSLLLRLMTYRLGEIPPSVAARLQVLNADVLDDLAVALFEFTSYADIEQWLARN